MALDALIAAGARRHKALVVTVNYSDFEAIRYYCDVDVIKASDFFKR
jgi:predicted nucleic acid-binding protein